MANEFQAAINYIAGAFQVQPSWLVWPSMLTVFVWPMVMNVFMFYYIMQKIFRVFPGPVNFILAGIFAFLALPFNQFTSLIAPLVIGWGVDTHMAVRVLLVMLFYAITFLVLPWVGGLRI